MANRDRWLTMTLCTRDRLRLKPPPEFLWHYTSASGLHGIVESDTIWASKIQYLNDSQEFIEATNLCRTLLQQRANDYAGSWSKQLISFLAESLGRIETVNVCVCSFTEERDLLSQWRGYCPTGAGYCLGIDSQSLITTFSQVKFTILPCEYNNFEQQVLLTDVINIVLPELLKIPQMSPDDLPQRPHASLMTFSW
jgi:hypothetical protein